jgi:transcriptional regulator with PAS, ATPase and Fis domain
MHGDDDDPADAEPTKAETLQVIAGPRLLAFWGSGSLVVELPFRGTLTIGRSVRCDVRIEDESISRRHAAIHVNNDDLRIEDLGSANGTRIGAVRIPTNERVRFAPGETVSMGKAMLLVQGVPEVESPGSTRSNFVAADHSPMERLYRLLDMVAKSELSVLLVGETGVGKEVLAERIHNGSPRRKGPLVRLNCAALPDALLESELFGHERGAFTGAVQAKPGLLESAKGGTVFLDEIGEMPLTTQAKLLRAIESREVLPVGALKPRPIDVRFVAATNRDLEQLVAEGIFRRDLYFRLNGIALQIPPLRERLDEIPKIASVFLRMGAEKTGRPMLGISRAALTKLERHPWPGNVRELRNVIERALVLCNGDTLEPEHILLGSLSNVERAEPIVPSPSRAVSERRRAGSESERDRIVRALADAGGNQKEAAKLLGISRRTLLNRLDEYNVPRPRK